MTQTDLLRPPAPDRIRELRFGPGAGIPNNPDLPVIAILGAVDPEAGPDAIRALYAANGWAGSWTGSVFDYHHYHPDAHEALTVASGRAVICLGGPEGETMAVSAGDAVILPAGIGHRLEEASRDFRICGSYPPGQAGPEIARAGDASVTEALARIARVALPRTDPIFGFGGPVPHAWGADEGR